MSHVRFLIYRYVSVNYVYFSTPCVNGRCTSPDVCTCDGGYVGGDCSQMLLVMILVPVIIVIVLVIGLIFFLRWFLKR